MAARGALGRARGVAAAPAVARRLVPGEERTRVREDACLVRRELRRNAARLGEFDALDRGGSISLDGAREVGDAVEHAEEHDLVVVRPGPGRGALDPGERWPVSGRD